MSFNASRSSQGRRDSGYWVEAPRMTDAIGYALRDAYRRDSVLSGDIQQLLRQLSYDKQGSEREPRA